MRPVRTRASNFVYKGDGGLVSDAWVQLEPGANATILTWKPSEEERAAIADGALIDLVILYAKPIPPTVLNVSAHRELSVIGGAIRDRALEVLQLTFPENPAMIPPGWWVVSLDMLEDGLVSEAFDPDREDGERTLFGRPVKADTAAPPATLRYQRAIEIVRRPMRAH